MKVRKLGKKIMYEPEAALYCDHISGISFNQLADRGYDIVSDLESILSEDGFEIHPNGSKYYIKQQADSVGCIEVKEA